MDLNFLQRKKPIAPRQRQDKCTIKTKRGKDGSITKTISGNCTKEQIQALKNEGALDDSFIVEE